MQDSGKEAAGGAAGATGATGSTGPTGTKVPGSTVESRAAELKALAAKYIPPSISVIIIMIVAWFLANWARRTTRIGLERARFDATLGKFFANTVRWIVLIIGVLFCLNVWDVNTTTFAAVLGAAGLAIGLALQGSLGNMAAGIMLLIFRPFKVGDSVTVAGQSGIVNEIDLFTTSMDTPDGRRIILPNGQIFGNTIENQTYHPRRRADVKLSIAANADIDHVRALLEHAAMGAQGRLEDPGPAVTLTAVGATLDWEISVWARTPEVGAVRQSLIKNIRDALAEAGFEFPTPVTAAVMRKA